MIIYLIEEEFKYICSNNFLPHILMNKIYNSSYDSKNIYEINISKEEAEKVRDLCGEQL